MHFAAVTALLWIALYNWRFWTETFSVVEPSSWPDILFLASIFVVMWLGYASALLLAPGAVALKAVAIAGCLLGAAAAYFADAYGTGIDREMIRNVVETDRREVEGLLNLRFGAYMVATGAIPALMLGRYRLERLGLRRGVILRVVFVAASALVSVALFAAFNAHFASFIREHKTVRYLSVPGNVVYGTVRYVSRRAVAPANGTLEEADAPLGPLGAQPGKPIVVFLVVGETARGDSFQLGGYRQATNPELSARLVHYFRNVTACGTATAVSLPCLFSGAGRAAFDVDRARRSTNLFDVLTQASVDVEWHENNSGCKGVCARVPTVNHFGSDDQRFCGKRGCYDEVLLDGLSQRVAGLHKDALLVFHQSGSHGPRYHERYPKQFEKFVPVCRRGDLNRCSIEEVRNAYDNSILYTDYVLARQIDILQQSADVADSLLIYVSDHGESLGELGLFLHGAPFRMAPPQQTKVPLLVWMSDGYAARFSIARACMQRMADQAFSHDNVYHTVLGAMRVRSARYQPGMDLLARCSATR